MNSHEPSSAALPSIAALIAVGVGGLTLLGWVLDIDVLKQPVPGAASMKANTAIGCVAAGLSLWLVASRRSVGLALALGVLTVLLGIITLSEDVLGWAAGIDQILFRDDTTLDGAPLGRMSPLTAACFVLIGLAIVATVRRRRAWIAQALAIAAAVVAAVALLGYLYQLQQLHTIGPTSGVAVHTAAVMLVLAAGVFLLQPNDGIAGVFAGDSTAARLPRRVIPTAILIPVVVGWLEREGQRLGWFSPELGDALVTITTVTLLGATMWVAAAILIRADGRRRDAERALQRANEKLEARVAEQTAELHRKEREAAANAAMFYHLFDQAPDAIVCVKPDRTIARFNAKAEELSGYRAAEAIGQPAEILLTEPQGRLFRESWSSFLTMTEPAIANAVGRRKDGREFPTEVMFSPTDSPSGQLIVAVVRDVSARREMEDALRLANERLQASERLEAIGRLAGGAAHDFNNMMTVVTGYSELVLSKMRDDDPFRPAIQEIRRAGVRGAALTRHLLAFSRRQVLSPTVIDLNALVAELCPMLPVLLGDAVHVSHVPDPDLWHVRIDASQIEQAIINIAMNARDAMPEGGTLRIETHNVVVLQQAGPASGEVPPGTYSQLTITDSGVGMDEATRERAFEPFFTTKPVGKGTGLGLSTVYGVVKQSGGFVEIESAEGSGTTVRIYLPRVMESVSVEPSVPATGGAAGSETVLLVDDDAAVRHLLTQVLEEAGYEVLDARDAHEALRICENHTGAVHLLIADVVMPNMSGTELAERLVRAGCTTRVLLVSGEPPPIGIETAMEGGLAFLAKPFTPGQLLQYVRDTLDQRSAGSARGR